MNTKTCRYPNRKGSVRPTVAWKLVTNYTIGYKAERKKEEKEKGFLTGENNLWHGGGERTSEESTFLVSIKVVLCVFWGVGGCGWSSLGKRLHFVSWLVASQLMNLFNCGRRERGEQLQECLRHPPAQLWGPWNRNGGEEGWCESILLGGQHSSRPKEDRVAAISIAAILARHPPSRKWKPAQRMPGGYSRSVPRYLGVMSWQVLCSIGYAGERDSPRNPLFSQDPEGWGPFVGNPCSTILTIYLILLHFANRILGHICGGWVGFFFLAPLTFLFEMQKCLG